MADAQRSPVKLDRRTLLIGGGAGAGLLVAWAVWPRTYLPNLSAGPGESLFGAWLKISTRGQVTVAVPQAELGQGSFTGLAQIVADELGADWRLIGVEAAPLNPLYANPEAAAVLFAAALGGAPDRLRETHAVRTGLALTGASSSITAFEGKLREAAAAARVMLCKAAAARWNVDWQSCGTANGFVVRDRNRIGFGQLAVDAAGQSVPAALPMRSGDANRLTGTDLPRLDVPAKVDGSVNFAGDIRLPGMMFAALRQGPIGTIRLLRTNDEAVRRIRGMKHIVKNDQWVAAVADNWWSAAQALDALAPRFEVAGRLIDTSSIDTALANALDGDGVRIARAGDLSPVFKGARVITADYQVGAALHAALEPMTATAAWDGGRLTMWMPSQAPGLARQAIADAVGISVDSVTLHVMMAGGSFGAKLEHLVGQQAAIIAQRVGKPVQLTWSRSEDCLHDRYRTPAAARMTARLGGNGQIMGWLAKIAAPPTSRELSARLMRGDPAVAASLTLPGAGDAGAVAGAQPFYRIPNYAVDHHPADTGVPCGHWRGGAHSYTAFFTECFVDELAHAAETDAIALRIGMLGGEPRMARCLSTVASLGGWQGGGAGTGQGVACHAFRGSYIAVMAEASVGSDQSVKVERLVAAVDCGRAINPALVLQQIEGGLIFGLSAATGGSTGFTENMADVRGFGDLGLPVLATLPDITVELIASDADPGGVGELGVPAVAPAIANALQSATGVRLRRLPLVPGGA